MTIQKQEEQRCSSCFYVEAEQPAGKGFEELAQKLGCHEVDATTINLTPRLFKK